MTPRLQARNVVAIDGPAASGKSTVAHEVARKLGFAYVNSGAMYRAATWLVLEKGVNLEDEAAITRLLASTPIDCDLQGLESRIRVDGVDPSPHLRDQNVNEGVSLVSSVPRVREVLVEKMRAYNIDNDVVMEGRDIGSVVFPHTPYKFYIDASPDIRSRRRSAQGQTDRIAARDRADSSRHASPLKIAPDAHVIDSSHVSIEAVVSEILEQLKAKGLEAATRPTSPVH
ncbi:MAG: (d)CMP kinase [Chthoniobacterales bacterium]|nr:(d)CMP kinase [Chthoniobacterales bacterium]